MIVENLKARENELKAAFEQGAAAMRRACMAEFMSRAEILRSQQRIQPQDCWSIASDLHLSANIADQEQSAYVISKLPVPEYSRVEGDQV